MTRDFMEEFAKLEREHKARLRRIDMWGWGMNALIVLIVIFFLLFPYISMWISK